MSDRPFEPFWISRNRVAGEISIKVDVWQQRPERLRFADGDVQWVVLDEGSASAHLTRWSIEHARLEVGNGVPETDRELLCVDRRQS